MSELEKMQKIFEESIILQSHLLDNIFLLSNSAAAIEVIKHSLITDIAPLTLHLIKQLPEEMKVQLLPSIIEVMRYLDGNTKLCQDIILTMDKEWLKNNIWFYSSHVFNDQDYQSIGIFMYLFNCFSEELSKKLANLALKSTDEDVREIGEIYLDKISKV